MTTEIRPSRGISDLDLRELWRRRELWYFLTWRDLKIRYRQTAFGFAWAVLQPVALTAVFSIFLGFLARVPSDGIPYPAFVLTGLVPWTLFASALLAASNSLVLGSEVISKVYFPRLLLPLSAATSYLLDFVIATLVLVVALLYYGFTVSLTLMWLPLIALGAFAVSVVIGTLMSAVNARYRDVQHALPLATQVWLFLTPVAYPASLVPQQWQWLYGLNPMTAVVEAFRWALLGTNPPATATIVSSVVGTMVLSFIAAIYFQRTESVLADVI
jgi:lipopolysaccharide transport system permease protein